MTDQLTDIIIKGRAWLKAIGLTPKEGGLFPFHDRATESFYTTPVSNSIEEIRAAFAPLADHISIEADGKYHTFKLHNGGTVGFTTHIGRDLFTYYIDLIAESETA